MTLEDFRSHLPSFTVEQLPNSSETGWYTIAFYGQTQGEALVSRQGRNGLVVKRVKVRSGGDHLTRSVSGLKLPVERSGNLW